MSSSCPDHKYVVSEGRCEEFLSDYHNYIATDLIAFAIALKGSLKRFGHDPITVANSNRFVWAVSAAYQYGIIGSIHQDEDIEMFVEVFRLQKIEPIEAVKLHRLLAEHSVGWSD